MASPILKFLTKQSFKHNDKTISNVRVRKYRRRNSSSYGDEYSNNCIIYIDKTNEDYEYVKNTIIAGQKITLDDGTMVKIIRKDILITMNAKEHHIRLEVV